MNTQERVEKMQAALDAASDHLQTADEQLTDVLVALANGAWFDDARPPVGMKVARMLDQAEKRIGLARRLLGGLTPKPKTAKA